MSFSPIDESITLSRAKHPDDGQEIQPRPRTHAGKIRSHHARDRRLLRSSSRHGIPRPHPPGHRRAVPQASLPARERTGEHLGRRHRARRRHGQLPFDKSQTPHCKSPVIHEHFGVAASTMQNKSKEIRDLLNMYQLSPEWMTPSRIDESPVAWLLQVNGLIVDARHMPREVQEIAYEKGLIPYIPADRPNNSD